MTPRLVLLTGPNGAGKSTFYEHFLSASALPFLNAGLVAATTGYGSFEAARVLDAARERMIEGRRGFVTETVFSDPDGHKLGMLRRAADAGYDITLIYIGVMSPDLLQRRVDQRVARGGHDVPRDKILDRYKRSLANLRIALRIAQTVKLYDNSSPDAPYQRVATFKAGVLTYRMQGRIPAWARDLVRGRAPRK